MLGELPSRNSFWSGILTFPSHFSTWTFRHVACDLFIFIVPNQWGFAGFEQTVDTFLTCVGTSKLKNSLFDHIGEEKQTT